MKKQLTNLGFGDGKGQLKEYEIRTATYKNRSVCSCGFPALNETVPLEKKYLAVVGSGMPMMWQCGGCHEMFAIEAVLVEDMRGVFLRLPRDIFNPESEWEL